mmetsp:Transcript_7905/g.11748  ORF Transcript_7905/g.11748 Transcript_7905/m.11748 type:complete len:108 (-) Transcript_7905:103-426(-)
MSRENSKDESTKKIRTAVDRPTINIGSLVAEPSYKLTLMEVNDCWATLYTKEWLENIMSAMVEEGDSTFSGDVSSSKLNLEPLYDDRHDRTVNYRGGPIKKRRRTSK